MLKAISLQTEEMFVNEILQPFFTKYDIVATPIIISTKRLKDGTKFKGGISNGNFNAFLSDLKKLIHSTPHGLVTTFIDYYAIPTSFPGYNERTVLKLQIDKVKFLERELLLQMESPKNFIPYIQLHEFETFILFKKWIPIQY